MARLLGISGVGRPAGRSRQLPPQGPAGARVGATVDGDPHRLTGGLGRPAQLYRGNDAAELNPPIKRPPGARAVRQDVPMRPRAATRT